MPQKVILDVDTGTDDAVALMTAALSPDLELVGATTVNGNTLVQNCTENTLRVFDYIGKSEIPVFQGMSLPLVRQNVQQAISAKSIHGDFLESLLRDISDSIRAPVVEIENFHREADQTFQLERSGEQSDHVRSISTRGDESVPTMTESESLGGGHGAFAPLPTVRSHHFAGGWI